MHNPIFKDSAGDPFVLTVGQDYYLSCTGGRAIEGFCGFQMYHSTDLQNWDEPKIILDFKDVSWAVKNAWAPSMAAYRGHYYLAFCADQQIGIAVCDTPDGTYRDIIGKPLISYYQDGFQTIDPCLFVENDKMYLFYGEGKCWLTELDIAPDHCECVGEVTDISEMFYRQVSQEYEIYDKIDKSVYNEAPDIVKIGDRYLFSWSVYDVLDYRYAVRYAWSDRLESPYLMPKDYDHDNILLQGCHDITGCGHACIVEMDGDWYILYGRHKKPRTYGRDMCCEKIVFLDEDHLTAVPSRA